MIYQFYKHSIFISLLFIILFIASNIGSWAADSDILLPNYGGTIRIGLHEIPDTLDPALSRTPIEKAISQQLFLPLFQIDASGELKGILVDSWSVSTDFITYTLILNNKIKLHDQSVIDAKTIIESLSRMANPAIKCPKSWIISPIKGYSAFQSHSAPELEGLKYINSSTFQIVLQHPSSNYLEYLALPETGIISQSTTSNHWEGTGPFTVSKFSPGNELQLAPFLEFHGGRPFINSLQFIKIVPEEIKVLEFELNRLDLITLPESDYRRISEDDKWKEFIIKVEPQSTLLLACNLTRSPVNNHQFREGLSRIIKRDEILTLTMNGHGQILDHLFSEDTLGSVQNNDTDLAGISDLLKPFTKHKIKLLIPDSPEILKAVGQKIQLQAQNYGINIEPEYTSYSDYYRLLHDGKYDLALKLYHSFMNKDEFILRELFTEPNLGKSGNISFYYNSEFQTQLESCCTTVQPEIRNQTLQKLTRTATQSFAYIPLLKTEEYWVQQPQLHGLNAQQLLHYDFHDVWVEDHK